MNGINQLLKETAPSKLTVDQVEMKFLGKKLASKDVLISLCQGEIYYPLWYFGGGDI